MWRMRAHRAAEALQRSVVALEQAVIVEEGAGFEEVGPLLLGIPIQQEVGRFQVEAGTLDAVEERGFQPGLAAGDRGLVRGAARPGSPRRPTAGAAPGAGLHQGAPRGPEGRRRARAVERELGPRGRSPGRRPARAAHGAGRARPRGSLSCSAGAWVAFQDREERGDELRGQARVGRRHRVQPGAAAPRSRLPGPRPPPPSCARRSRARCRRDTDRAVDHLGFDQRAARGLGAVAESRCRERRGANPRARAAVLSIAPADLDPAVLHPAPTSAEQSRVSPPGHARARSASPAAPDCGGARACAWW